ncbi:MAG: IS66 family insertion sequence element accessory protein TnpB [Acetobacteraceae bacterium]
MIQLTAATRILVAVEPVDFRGGIDALAALARSRLRADPYGGTLIVFRNRRRTAVKLLTYDGQGFWLATKRLSRGRFPHWPAGSGTAALAAHELAVLLMGGDPTQARAAPTWRALPQAA